MRRAEHSLRRLPWAAVAAGAVALAVYHGLAMASMPSGDAHAALLAVERGQLDGQAHLLYVPLLALANGVLGPLGFSLFESASLVSAAGVAVGLSLQLAADRRLGTPPGEALLALALTAAAMPVVYYACSVELHGPFYAAYGGCCLAAVAAARHQGLLQLGGLAGAFLLACGLHSSGLLLPALLLPLWLAARREGGHAGSRRARLREAALAALFGAAVVALAVAGAWAVQAAGVRLRVDAHGGFAGAGLAALARDPAVAFGVAWREAVLAYVPLSLLWWIGWFDRRARPWAIAVAVGGLPFLGAAVLILGDQWHERGAYLLPIAWPAAVSAARATRGRGRIVAWGAVAVSAVLAVTAVRREDDAGRVRAFAAGARQLAGGAPLLLLIGGYDDVEATLVALPQAQRCVLGRLVGMPAAALAAQLPQIDAYLERALGAGATVLLTEDAERALAQAGATHANAALLLAHLRQRYRLEPVAASGFSGKRLRALP